MRLRLRLLIAITSLIFLGISAAWADAGGSPTVMVPMRDGVKLATDVHLPKDGGPKFPVVVARTVYGRAPKGFEKAVEDWNKSGYVLVIQDTRGRGDSEGKDLVFADDGWGERQDGADTIEWVAKQEWCNGKIGTWGMSALGITQVLMAGATDKVACQSIMVAASEFYGQLSYQGGVFRKSLCEGWLRLQKRPEIIDLWHSHPTYDDFWKLLNAEARAPHATAPALHVGGWWDIFGPAAIYNFATRQHDGGQGAKGNQKLIMGAWVHGPREKPGDLVMPKNFNFDFGKYERRFLEYWLKNTDNGIMSEPPINYYTIGDVFDPKSPGNEWRTANDWPPFPTVETAYYLAEENGLSTESPVAEAARIMFTYDPADPCPTHGGAELLLPPGPFNQRTVSTRSDVLTFATKSLEKPIEITGKVKVRLFVSTDAPDTDFTAKLIDVYPDGKEILMLDNIRRLKFRDGYERPEPLKPDAIGPIEIDLWEISLIFNAGHRIGLHVSSSNYPRFEKNPNTGEDLPGNESRLAHNCVYMDKAHPSALLLSVRPAGE